MMGLAQRREQAADCTRQLLSYSRRKPAAFTPVTRIGRKSPCQPPELGLVTLGTLRITRLSADGCKAVSSATRDSNPAGTLRGRGSASDISQITCPRVPRANKFWLRVPEQPLQSYLAGTSPHQPHTTCLNPHGTATATLATPSLCLCGRMAVVPVPRFSLCPLGTRCIGCSGKKGQRGIVSTWHRCFSLAFCHANMARDHLNHLASLSVLRRKSGFRATLSSRPLFATPVPPSNRWRQGRPRASPTPCKSRWWVL